GIRPRLYPSGSWGTSVGRHLERRREVEDRVAAELWRPRTIVPLVALASNRVDDLCVVELHIVLHSTHSSLRTVRGVRNTVRDAIVAPVYPLPPIGSSGLARACGY